MKRLILHIVYFILIFGLLNAVVVLGFRATVLKRTYLYQKEKQFWNYQDTLTYLCLGDSRIQNALDTRIIDNCFNFSSPNESYIQTYYKFRTLLEKGVRPKVLLLPMDQTSFSEKYAKRFKYNYYWVNYIDFFELAHEKHDWKMAVKYFHGQFFPYADEYDLVNQYVSKRGKQKENTMVKGFRPRFKNFALEPDARQLAYDKAAMYLKGGIYWDKSVVHYVEKLLKLAEEHKVRVVLIKMPMTKEYLQGIALAVPGIDFYERLDGILQAYPNVKLFDYANIYEDDKSLFWNPDHLNYRGSQLFSRRLKKDLEVMDP